MSNQEEEKKKEKEKKKTDAYSLSEVMALTLVFVYFSSQTAEDYTSERPLHSHSSFSSSSDDDWMSPAKPKYI